MKFISGQRTAYRTRLKFAFTGMASLTLVSCGGGGGGGNATPSLNGLALPSSQPTYTVGVYEKADNLDQQCETPRTGVDSEGFAFPDTDGSSESENFWIRSWTRETYLWPLEVPDIDPATYTDPLAYFETQKTSNVTESGESQDDFHFVADTADFLAFKNSDLVPRYGATLAFISSTPPRDIRVVYTEPNTPASGFSGGRPAWERGARILSIDGVDAINESTEAGIDILDDGLSPLTAGESHVFTMLYTDGEINDVTLVSANLASASDPVSNIQTFDTDSGKVGYIQFNTFSPYSSEEEIVNAIADIRAQGVSDLVLDLRYNGGGLLAVSSQLAYMIAGPQQTDGKTFEQLRFNNGTAGPDPVTGGENAPVPFLPVTLGFENLAPNLPLPSLDLDTVYILSTDGTCSASEALINGLLGIDVEVVLIGDTTCGKPYGFYPQDNCGNTYFTIQFEGLNDKGEGGYTDGFKPADASGFGTTIAGCSVVDDLNAPIGTRDDPFVSAALEYRLSGQCPASASSSPVTTSGKMTSRKLEGSGHERLAVELTLREVLERNRDLSWPKSEK